MNDNNKEDKNDPMAAFDNVGEEEDAGEEDDDYNASLMKKTEITLTTSMMITNED